jgi:nicotinate-nucleotide adenylyltransferase
MRLGVFGGTFDPPHIGHLIVASDVCAALDLDRVVFVPSATPPHKRGRVHASAEQRFEMVRAAVAADPRFAVDDLELRREGESYSVDTLRELRASEPDADLFFIIGADQLREFDRWHQPEEVARLATLVVMSRAGDEADGEVSLPVRRVAVTRIDLSATRIRERIGRKASIRYLVPDVVREIIEREKLYE